MGVPFCQDHYTLPLTLFNHSFSGAERQFGKTETVTYNPDSASEVYVLLSKLPAEHCRWFRFKAFFGVVTWKKVYLQNV